MANYVVDFACHGRRLIVEVDGGRHTRPEHAERDRIRDAVLASQGYRVVRVQNCDVHADVDEVVNGIVSIALARPPTHQPSAGPPSPRGGGMAGGDGAVAPQRDEPWP